MNQMKRIFTLIVIVLSSFFNAGLLAEGKIEATKENIAQGKRIYQKQCAVCHGIKGNGDGHAAYILYPKPGDFTSGNYKFRSTASGELPTDEDLFRTVSNGVPGAAMAPFKDILSEKERWQVVFYIKTFSHYFEIPDLDPYQAIVTPGKESHNSSLDLTMGNELFQENKGGCTICHGKDGKGDGPEARSYKNDRGYPIKATDLTSGWRYKNGNSIKDIFRTLSTGINGTSMPSYAESLPEDKRWQLAHYVQSLIQKGTTLNSKKQKIIISKFIKGEIPKYNPWAKIWDKANIIMIPLMMLWDRDERILRIEVKSLNNGKQIAFLLSWKDSVKDSSVLLPQQFRDAIAVQFPLTTQTPFFGMGDEEGTVNIWHWKADWEEDIKSFKDIEKVYPTMSWDNYPFRERTYFTGWAAGSLISKPNRKTSVEDLNAMGLGTLTSQPPEDQNVFGRGLWKKGTWKVIFIRSLESKSLSDVKFAPGKVIPMAFALWDGSKGDRGGEKSVSIWHKLFIEH